MPGRPCPAPLAREGVGPTRAPPSLPLQTGRAREGTTEFHGTTEPSLGRPGQAAPGGREPPGAKGDAPGPPGGRRARRSRLPAPCTHPQAAGAGEDQPQSGPVDRGSSRRARLRGCSVQGAGRGRGITGEGAEGAGPRAAEEAPGSRPAADRLLERRTVTLGRGPAADTPRAHPQRGPERDGAEAAGRGGCRPAGRAARGVGTGQCHQQTRGLETTKQGREKTHRCP